MADTAYRSGAYSTVKKTAGANVALGEVVLLGSVTANTGGAGALAAIAHQPITNAALGTLAIGGGIYDCVNLNNAADGTKVYWDDVNNKVTTASTNNAVFGYIVSGGAGGANSTCQVLHKPYYGGN